jgi:CheY-like chemotaxis protein
MARVLLLEDNDRFARAVQRVLRGHEVVHVKTVESAIDELIRGGVDCALIDLNLTDEDDYSGYEVLSYILRSVPDLPRAVVTGSRLKGAISKNILLRYGVSDIIMKGDVDRDGYGTRDLVDTVSDLLEGSQTRRRTAAKDEITSVSASTQAELRRRIEALQQFADQLGRGVLRRDATAKRRASLNQRMQELVDLESREKARCESAPLNELASLVAEFEREAGRKLGDS